VHSVYEGVDGISRESNASLKIFETESQVLLMFDVVHTKAMVNTLKINTRKEVFLNL
jgi:hypothetical protein